MILMEHLTLWIILALPGLSLHFPFPSRERQMNAAFQQEAGQSDFGRWERFGLNCC